ncbi:MAG: aldose 1-epimerase, partial [Planctomycetales bacterium]|nr:aldose 1-epimerase [Planctomycetales bacterium]
KDYVVLNFQFLTLAQSSKLWNNLRGMMSSHPFLFYILLGLEILYSIDKGRAKVIGIVRKLVLGLVLAICGLAPISASDVVVQADSPTGFEVYVMTVGDTVVKLCPKAGANAYSISVDGVEYLRQPESLEQLPGVGYGNPVLYPMPNRVKNSEFTFGGQRVRFEPNAGGNFIHGLVNRHHWAVDSVLKQPDHVSVRCSASFENGEELARLFPFPHVIYLTVTVRANSVRWTYQVDNSQGQASVPFGFALHPYFIYQGERAETYLTIPATHWMQSTQQLPSGKLVPASELDYSLGKPLSLAGTRFDDVFWGMTPERQTLIDFRGAQRQVEIAASAEFTHLVVWTPDRPYFGVESQTCSTDAHNLHADGFQEAAHLQICPPGDRLSGWVEYSFPAKR